jgi:lipopolysaccharide/colanic/teichoic acid biosynthesis glycosyltransferase
MYGLSKRIFDVGVAAIALLLLAPVLLVVALLVRVKLGAPVLYRQTRPGLHGEPFEILKFRTMIEEFDESGEPLPNEERITPFGQLLRSSSLDELPELWNIFKGDMSLVGPRPLLMAYLPLYNEKQSRRHEVPPGLTGWSQVNGRNAITWEEKFDLDVWYVDNASFLLDLKILTMTVLKVIRRDGIVYAGDVAMPRFRGSCEKHHQVLGREDKY